MPTAQDLAGFHWLTAKPSKTRLLQRDTCRMLLTGAAFTTYKDGATAHELAHRRNAWRRHPMTDEPIDIGVAYTVQDLATELKVYRTASLSERRPWPRFVWSLWSKTFVRSTGSGAHPKSPPMPEELPTQVTNLDPLSAVAVIVGRARAVISGQSAAVEIAYVEQHTRRFLETAQGRERQAYLDRNPTP